jgi:hypothetical protein
VIKTYFETHDIGRMEKAINNISAFKFYPVLNEQGETIGTRTIFINESDFGGVVPKWIVQFLIPKTLHELFDDVVTLAKSQKE